VAARRWRRFALSFAVAQCVATVYQRLPILAIGWLFGPGVVGLYAWAERFATLPQQLVANAIGDVYRQHATAEYHRSGRFDALMLRTVKTTALIAVVPFALGICLAPWLFERLFGPAWAEAGNFAAIFLIGDFFCFVITPIDKAAVIRQRTGFILACNSARVAGKTLIVAYVLMSGSGARTFIWMLVALRIAVYLFSFAYALHLARGDASDKLSALPSAQNPPG
jgi:O-antigen/teichoic acid export membrane protein